MTILIFYTKFSKTIKYEINNKYYMDISNLENPLLRVSCKSNNMIWTPLSHLFLTSLISESFRFFKRSQNVSKHQTVKRKVIHPLRSSFTQHKIKVTLEKMQYHEDICFRLCLFLNLFHMRVVIRRVFCNRTSTFANQCQHLLELFKFLHIHN